MARCRMQVPFRLPSPSFSFFFSLPLGVHPIPLVLTLLPMTSTFLPPFLTPMHLSPVLLYRSHFSQKLTYSTYLFYFYPYPYPYPCIQHRHDTSPLMLFTVLMSCVAVYRSGTRCIMAAIATCVAVLTCFATLIVNQTRYAPRFIIYRSVGDGSLSSSPSS